MTVTRTTQDTDALTLTIVAELAAPPERVWRLWSDPRQLERWWGPPTWPASFSAHELVAGSRSHYVMTGPQGEQAAGWWLVLAVDEPRSLEFEDGFSDEAGEPDPAMPTTRAHVELEETDGGTRLTITSTFATPEQMEQLARMGMVEGMTEAMNQMDELLAA